MVDCDARGSLPEGWQSTGNRLRPDTAAGGWKEPVLPHPDGAGDLQATTPRVPAPRTPADDRPSRPRHAADPLTGEYPGMAAAMPRTPAAPTLSAVPGAGAAPDREPPTVRTPAATPTPSSSGGRPAGSNLPPTVPRPDWAGSHDETMVLPAFLTGTAKQPPPPPSGPKRPDPTAKLDGTERGMLIFVAALLGLGTIAVVAFMGMGLGGSKPKPAAAPTPSVSVAAPTPSAAASPSPSDSPSATDSPTPSPTRTTVAPRLLGSVSSPDLVTAYCRATVGRGAYAKGPGLSGPLAASSWVCSSSTRDSNTTPISPTSVCRWQFQDNTAYTSAKATDALPWKCYT